MYYAYLLTFCKIVVGTIFTIASFLKLKSFTQYVNTINDFHLLPKSLTQLAAVLILTCEMLTVLLLFKWLLVAFWLASGLLVIFSIALASVLFRNIQTACNCFGSSQHLISPADLWRNFGFLLCTGVGSWLATKPEATVPIEALDLSIVGFMALAFVLLWMQLSEIYRLFQLN